MIVRVKQSHLFVLLIRPSWISFTACCLGTTLVLAAAFWPTIHDQATINAYLSTDYGLNALLDDFNTLLGTAWNSKLFYNVLVICFATLVGLLVYVGSESFRHMFAQTRATFTDISEATPQNRRHIATHLGVRIGLRVATAALWFIYILLFFRIVLPFCAAMVSRSTGAEGLTQLASNFWVFALLLAASHVHIIFVRLLVLRPRLFGSLA